MKTKIYIGEEARLLDMFGDEPVQITSKLSDIEKLSNVFNDYSNSFTVPATPNNNTIFKHYYEYRIDNGFNANISVPGYIEIDSLPFRTGQIRLESVVLKGHRPSTYKITFFGSLRQLTDLFGDDTIDRLDYTKDIFGNETKTLSTLSQFDYDYTGPNFLNSINNPSFNDGNVITPLIAYADRDWNYGTNDSTDIKGGPEAAGAILDTELRPAIRIYNILLGIEAKYGISFTRDFFGKAVFNNLFMWMNAATEFTFGEDELEPDILDAFAGDNDGSIVVDGNVVAITHRKYTTPGPEPGSPSPGRFIAIWQWDIYPDNLSIKYDAHIVYGGGSATDTAPGTKVKSFYSQTGVKSFNYTLEAQYGLFPDPDGTGINTSMRTDSFYLILVPSQTMLFDMQVNAKYLRILSGATTVYAYIISTPNNQTLLVQVHMDQNIPRMKVIDFLQGIMKMFKLIIRPISETSFYIDTLNGYYSRGNILNINNYVDNTEVLIERPLIYKTLTFLYQKTDNVTGMKFRELNEPVRGYAYGDLRTVYSSIDSKEELKIELPFENMMFERLVVENPDDRAGELTNISIGQSSKLDTDGTTLSANDSKPILFFNNGISVSSDFPFLVNFQGEIDSVSYPYVIGNTNDAMLYQVTDSINFGSEIDPWHLLQVDNSLYLNYWEDWINTIYSLKQRKFTYTANLPARFIQELSLNDRILIGDSRFKINDFTLDIPTGKTNLVLFNDIFEYQEPQPVVAITTIEANAGTKYYGIPLNTESSWYVALLDEGFGTDWVEVLTPSGTGSTEIVIRVLQKANQMPPEVYEYRVMTINIWVGTEAYSILLTQRGLGEAP